MFDSTHSSKPLLSEIKTEKDLTQIKWTSKEKTRKDTNIDMTPKSNIVLLKLLINSIMLLIKLSFTPNPRTA